jgi:hypothetical protein
MAEVRSGPMAHFLFALKVRAGFGGAAEALSRNSAIYTGCNAEPNTGCNAEPNTGCNAESTAEKPNRSKP